ncbi:MAG: hypothetical protein KGZ40_02970 [Clostridiales bacterium]|nr:hypothetical protein [Clostridiales bacterium]
MLGNRVTISEALSALGARLEAMGTPELEIVVIGGAALSVLGFVDRSTRDVDVLALGVRTPDSVAPLLIKSHPLPDALRTAAKGVQRDLGLREDWLNAGPTNLLDHGLPAGFAERLVGRRFDTRLLVHFPAREDLIALKVYAAAGTGVGRHTQDLVALGATPTELLAGARWARSQDPSTGFKSMLLALLRYCDALAEAEVFDSEP